MHTNLQIEFENFLFREQLLSKMKKCDINFTKICTIHKFINNDKFNNDKKTNLNIFTNKIIFSSKILNLLLIFIKKVKNQFILLNNLFFLKKCKQKINFEQ